jgi:hypothetical protein
MFSGGVRNVSKFICIFKKYFLDKFLSNIWAHRKKVGDSPDIFNLRAPLGKRDFYHYKDNFRQLYSVKTVKIADPYFFVFNPEQSSVGQNTSNDIKLHTGSSSQTTSQRLATRVYTKKGAIRPH